MIPLFKPNLGIEELKELEDTFKSGWITLGPKTEKLENLFSKYIGTKYAIGLNSCTAALEVALKSYNFKFGEVLVPTITFASTAHAIIFNGLKPVFTDIDEDTFCIDIEDIKKKINSKTKAIMAVHLGGHPCDMDAIMEIANEKGIKVIEDAAEACGAEYKGRKVGSIGHVGCFSFEAKKNMTTGDGGMITTNDPKIFEFAKTFRWCGINKNTWERNSQSKYSWYYEVSDFGRTFNMNDIQASIGLAQFKKLDIMNNNRRIIVEKYLKEFKNLKKIICPKEMPWAKSAWWIFILKMKNRDEFTEFMSKNGISTGVHFMPLHLQPVYKDYKEKANTPIADRIWKEIVDLPLFPDMSELQIKEVTEKVKEWINNN